MKGVEQFVTAGLRVKATWAGEFTSLIIKNSGGQTVFRGAINFALWPLMKEALDGLGAAENGSKT